MFGGENDDVIRNRLLNLSKEISRGYGNCKKKYDEMSVYGVAPLLRDETLDNNPLNDYSPSDFVFDLLNLPKYIGEPPRKVKNMLTADSNSGKRIFERVEKPDDDVIVAYYYTKTGPYNHMGLCRRLKEEPGEPLVICSKWGKEGSIFLQTDLEKNGLFRIPIDLGNQVDFYRFLGLEDAIPF
ncbi:MAG: hypothetical protein JW716_01075 [Candidatus Aenigmarchaeota archaeon]|nr:hypothetical protein [Candidatus Aenigmarchaeota archaeon]